MGLFDRKKKQADESATTDVSVELIRSIIENLRRDTDEWTQLAMVLEIQNGELRGTYGYVYSPDSTVAAVSARPSTIQAATEAYLASYFTSNDAFPVKLLVQFDRVTKQYEITFEDTDTTRWQVTPQNIATIREELRPSFGERKQEVVFRRANVWLPTVVRNGDELWLELAAGADANHDPRTFRLPISEAHADVLKNDLARHLLLWAALVPLADKAGTHGAIDEQAAAVLLDALLLGSEAEAEEVLKTVTWHKASLVAHHADAALLDRGEVFASLEGATEQADQQLRQEYVANTRRKERGVQLTPLDEALLRYTGRYLHGAGRAVRKPDAVAAELLPQVLEIVAVGERASQGMELKSWVHTEHSLEKKQEWQTMQAAVEAAVRGAYPMLADDAVETVAILLCSEAASRARQ